jgi:predicted CoA-binding protein
MSTEKEILKEYRTVAVVDMSRKAGLKVVMDKCMLKEHQKL